MNDIYHVCTECPIGALVKGEYRRSGKDPRRLCIECSRLIKLGRC